MIRILVWVIMLVGGGILGIYLDSILFADWLTNPWFHAISFFWGLIIARLVVISSKNTGRVLARLGRVGNIPRLKTNRLVTVGYYACMRHPMHFGLLFFPLAVALLIGSVSFILFIVPLEMAFMVLMIKYVEEPQTLEKFGEDYIQYCKQVPMFSLYPECLRQLFEISDLNKT